MDKNLKMVRGDTFSFGIEYDFDDESTQDLDTCYFSCKLNSDDDEYVFQKSIGDGISKVDDNQYRVRIAPEDTQNIKTGKYYYDLQIGLNNDVFTIIKGVLTIEREITREWEHECKGWFW